MADECMSFMKHNIATMSPAHVLTWTRHPSLFIPQQKHIVEEGIEDSSPASINHWYEEGNTCSNNSYEWQGTPSDYHFLRWKMAGSEKGTTNSPSHPSLCHPKTAAMDESMLDLWIKQCHSPWKTRFLPMLYPFSYWTHFVFIWWGQSLQKSNPSE